MSSSDAEALRAYEKALLDYAAFAKDLPHSTKKQAFPGERRDALMDGIRRCRRSALGSVHRGNSRSLSQHLAMALLALPLKEVCHGL